MKKWSLLINENEKFDFILFDVSLIMIYAFHKNISKFWRIAASRLLNRELFSQKLRVQLENATFVVIVDTTITALIPLSYRDAALEWLTKKSSES